MSATALRLGGLAELLNRPWVAGREDLDWRSIDLDKVEWIERIGASDGMNSFGSLESLDGFGNHRKQQSMFGGTGGYFWMDSWILANIVQLGTQRFCRQFLNRTNDPCGRQDDQMTQAGPSPGARAMWPSCRISRG